MINNIINRSRSQKVRNKGCSWIITCITYYNFSCCKSFSERYSRERWAIWKSLPAATRPPCQLLHRVKVDEHAPGTAAAAGAEANRARQERHSVKSGSSDGGGPSTGVCKKQAG